MQADRMPLLEECVTFQVALIGSDGLVVGSDQLSNRQSQDDMNETPTIEMSKQEKFVKSDDGSLLCFFAGGPTSQNVASTIAAHCAGTPTSNLSWERKVRSKVRSVELLRGAPIGDQIIVVRKHIPTAVCLVQRSLQGATFVNEYKEQPVCIGNNALAKFLVTHLWEPGRTILELKKLALLTLAYAAKENPGGVGGPFDLMTLDNNQNFDWSPHQSADTIFAAFQGKLEAAFDELP